MLTQGTEGVDGMDNLSETDLKNLLKLKEKEKKKGNFSKRIVTFVILLNVLFTLGVLYVFTETGNEPMTLVGAWFAFTTVELWSLSKIKREEVKEDNEND